MRMRVQSIGLLALPISMMSATQLVMAVLSYTVFKDGQASEFIASALGILLLAAVFGLTIRRSQLKKIGFKDALFYVSASWIILGLCGAIPIILIAQTSITDGVFESVSAITTTGATILTGLDDMPHSFLLYRQFLQWLGGLGIVIFVVAILPMLNMGGMKLLKAETPGPMKDDKIVPKVTHTAKYLWAVYIWLTIFCALAYYWVGMNAFDAIAHALTTLSTGGFSTHDASMGYFNNPSLLVVSDIFMVLGALSFALHYRVFHSKKLSAYWQDEETRLFFYIMLAFILLLTSILEVDYPELGYFEVLNLAAFHLISFITSTGYGAADFTHWPMVIALILVISGYFGGCAGSTAGGNKIIRNIITGKMMYRELRRLMHPSGVFPIKYNHHIVQSRTIEATISFMFVSAFSSLVLTLVLMTTGLDFWSSFTAVSTCLNVLGPAFGELSSNFIPVSDSGTWLLSGAMILGRLEYFSLLALLLPAYWRL